MTQLIYPHRFFLGGVSTFTAHLLWSTKLNHRCLFRPAKKSEFRWRDFGYGIYYQNLKPFSITTLSDDHSFVMMIKKEYFDTIKVLDNHRKITVVIHDPRDLDEEMAAHMKDRGWQIITIRESVQNYLRERFDLDSIFRMHPFYCYPVPNSVVAYHDEKFGSACISRIGYGKNIDIILRANKIINGFGDPIDLFGALSKFYAYKYLPESFDKYYRGQFTPSFHTLSNILEPRKFVVDLSVVNNDGGGTQYTFLEAIYHDCALILNRRWIENVDKKYRIFKEGYNCLAIDSPEELAEIIYSDIDTTVMTERAKYILLQCANSDWSDLIAN